MLAEQILDEQELTKEEVGKVFELFQASLIGYMTDRESVTSTDMRKLLEDAIDRIKRKHRPTASPAQTSYNPSPEQYPDQKRLPSVDIYEDPGIWVCLDEGCNSNCHSQTWADDAERKLQNMPIKQKFYLDSPAREKLQRHR